MRVVIVGTTDQRRRLREAVSGTAIEIVGEFATVAAARAAAIDADALLLPASSPARQAADDDLTLPAEALTTRETEVLELVAEGLPNKAIADRLGISDQTVKFHVAQICAKLGATNRTDAVRRALERGLITI